jgi:hypothetical protein
MWKPREIKHLYGGLNPGATTHVNHDNCPAGVDTRRRLYITKSDDNQKLKLYCHNCSKGTIIDLTAVRLRPVAPALEPKKLELPPVAPGTVTPSMYSLTAKHKLLLGAYGILDHALDRNVYSASDCELVFPVEQENELQGYQIRYTDGRRDKWLSRGDPQAWWVAGNLQLVCEDIVSAYKWFEATGEGYCCQAGARPTIGHVWVQACVVWYDNDNEAVLDAARTAVEIGPRHNPNILITGGTDPKRYTKDELKKVADVCNQLILTPPPDGRSYHVLEIREPGKGVCA